MRKTKYKSQLHLKKTALALVGTACLGLAVMSPQSASAIDLRYHSIVQDDTIKLGDIFTGLEGAAYEHKADRVLGISPRPGDDLVLNARTLLRIAKALDLPWRPSSTSDQVVLRRAATVIESEMINDTIAEALHKKGLEGDFELISSTGHEDITLPENMPMSVEISELEYDPQRNSYHAIVVAPSLDNPVKRLELQGQIQRMVAIPVLKEPARFGEVIRANDISFLKVPQRSLKHNIITDAEDLVGMTPRRILYADQAITSNEINAPRIVNRGDNVTMIYKSGSLTLTAIGRAMEFGSKGEPVRVTNLTSSKTVEAIVSGEREVTIESF
tara:strand:- start:193 stop:1179 length:987 start_codon:yes stop_codon:yes gene_type:complete